jgi:hypothetical protein
MAGKLKRQRTKWTARLWRAVMHHRFPLFQFGAAAFRFRGTSIACHFSLAGKRENTEAHASAPPTEENMRI